MSYSESELDQHATEIHDQLPDTVADNVSPDDIEGRLTTLVSDYKVPLNEARQSVINHYLDETGTDRDDLSRDNQGLDLAAVEAPEQWLDVTAKVVALWDPQSDAIAQVGRLGDETGTIKFTKWATSDLPELEENQVYRLGNVVTDAYQGRYSVKLNRTTTIETVDTAIEVEDNAVEIEGALVDIQRGSGLTKRCPTEECTRVLQNGRCSEHGDVEGEFDLRIKGVIDDGGTVQGVTFDQDKTEEEGGVTLQEAKDMAMDALDTAVVAEKVRDTTLGRYYRMRGPVMGQYLLVNEVERFPGPADSEEILIRARSI